MKIIIILLLFTAITACHTNNSREVQTTLVKLGTFSEEMNEEGTLRAVHSIGINAPRISYRYGSLKIANMVEDGKEVEKGDTIIIFDPSELQKAIIDLEQKLEIAKAEYDKLIATQQSEIEDLEADLEIARIALEISKINFEQSVHEAEITKKEIQLKLENAAVALDRAGEQIENKKRIHQVDAFQKMISIKQLQLQLDDANQSINSLFIVSPANGITITEYNWITSRKWQIGDQPYSGTKILELPDLDTMMAEVKISEVDIIKLSAGLKVRIIPDAYSDTVFQGEISTIANLAQNKDRDSRVKVFPVDIVIEGRNNKLMPGLTVACKIKINEIHDVLMVPLESVFKEDVNDYVYVKTVSGFKRREVKIGARNSDYALITEGLSENEELALSNPFLNKQETTE
jgi:HlyD family secretion protein